MPNKMFFFVREKQTNGSLMSVKLLFVLIHFLDLYCVGQNSNHLFENSNKKTVFPQNYGRNRKLKDKLCSRYSITRRTSLGTFFFNCQLLALPELK